MNSLPLSPVVISYATMHKKTASYMQVLRNTVGNCSKLVPRPFPALQFCFSAPHTNIDKGGNPLPNHFERTLRKFARISKFRCFHETKQTQNQVRRFFNNSVTEFVSNTFAIDIRRILESFAKVFHKCFSQYDRTVT